MKMMRSDVNQIAARTLWAAINPDWNSDRSPQERAGLAGKFSALEKHQPITHAEIAEFARMGAAHRWGSATLGIMPKDSSNVDVNQIAKRILDEATGDRRKTLPPVKDQAAVESGARGGRKGGAARAAKLTPEQRAEIAKKAAAVRWKKP